MASRYRRLPMRAIFRRQPDAASTVVQTPSSSSAVSALKRFRSMAVLAVRDGSGGEAVDLQGATGDRVGQRLQVEIGQHVLVVAAGDDAAAGQLHARQGDDVAAAGAVGDPEQIGRAHAELQSLMRHSYAVFCL